jgi:hypothetical protein
MNKHELVTLSDEKVVEALQQVGRSILCPDSYRETLEHIASLPQTETNKRNRLTMLFMLVYESATDLLMLLRPAFGLDVDQMTVLAARLEPTRERFFSRDLIEPEFCKEALETYHRLVIDKSNSER